MELNIRNLWVVNIGGLEIWITETIVNTWIIMVVLIVLALIARIRLRRFSLVPRGFQNVVETVVEMFDNLPQMLSKQPLYIAPWFYGLCSSFPAACSCLVSGAHCTLGNNIRLGFVPCSDVFGIRHRKGDYIKSFSAHPILFPLNLSVTGKPVSLSFRLFSNMLSGTIILYYQLTVTCADWIPNTHAFFDDHRCFEPISSYSSVDVHSCS